MYCNIVNYGGYFMKKVLSFILAVVMTVFLGACFSLNSVAEEIYVPDDGSMKNLEIAKVTTAPIMDGQVDDSYTKIFDISGSDSWYQKPDGDGNMNWVKDNHALVDGNSELRRYDIEENPERTSSEWYNSRFEGYASWDATNLYLCVVITTPHKINDNPAGVDSWRGDSMTVAAYNALRSGATEFVFSQDKGDLQVYPTETWGISVLQKRKTYDTTKTVAKWGITPEGGFYVTDTGYVYELTLGWSVGFGVTAAENVSVPFNVAVSFNNAVAKEYTMCGIQAGAGIYNEGGRVNLLTKDIDDNYLGFALKLVDSLTCEHSDSEWVIYKEFSETECSGEARRVCKDCGEIIATKYINMTVPYVVDVNCKSIHVSDVSGFEYRLKGGQWQKTGLFDNLLPETEYIIEYRFENSEQIYSLTVKTHHIDTDNKLEHDSTGHFHICDICHSQFNKEIHRGGIASCSQAAVCKVCGSLYDEKDLSNHKNVVIREKKIATCNNEGYTGDTYCLDCGEKIASGQTIDRLEHEYRTEVVPPTKDCQGYTLHTCILCGDSYKDNYSSYIGENDPVIEISSVRGLRGKQVKVAVSLKNNPGIASMSLKIDYDANILKLVNVEDCGVLGSQVHSPDLGASYYLNWENDAATENFTANGNIAILTFEILEDSDLGTTPVNVSYDYDNYDIYNVNVERIRFKLLDGNIEVSKILLGDVNNDGEVNNYDRLLLTRWLAKWSEVLEKGINETAADVNCDGKVNNLDRLILIRHLAHWEEYAYLPYTK